MLTDENSTPKPDAITAPQLRYTSEGRFGTIQYVSSETTFDVGWEFAGGNAVAILFVPSPQHWEAQTHTALTQRAGILQFIGEQVIKDRLGETVTFWLMTAG